MTEPLSLQDKELERAVGTYSKRLLRSYDMFVVGFSNSRAWRCPREVMLDQYNRCLGARHLDVGPGTGWYLAHAQLPAGADITLLDLSPNSLASASSRLGGVTHQAVFGNVLEPLPGGLGPFDSIAVNYVFHCIPGSWAEKGQAFPHLADGLADDGVLFGSTILGQGVRHNLLGRFLMAFYNKKGVFHNREDDEAGLTAALQTSFDQVEVTVVGTVAMFTARGPRRRA